MVKLDEWMKAHPWCEVIAGPDWVAELRWQGKRRFHALYGYPMEGFDYRDVPKEDWPGYVPPDPQGRMWG
jgi:hypothetical protein